MMQGTILIPISNFKSESIFIDKLEGPFKASCVPLSSKNNLKYCIFIMYNTMNVKFQGSGPQQTFLECLNK